MIDQFLLHLCHFIIKSGRLNLQLLLTPSGQTLIVDDSLIILEYFLIEFDYLLFHIKYRVTMFLMLLADMLYPIIECGEQVLLLIIVLHHRTHLRF